MTERDPATGRFPKGSGVPAGGAGNGPPKERAAFTPDAQPPALHKVVGKEVAQEVRARIAARKHEIVDRLIDNALHGETAQSNQAGIYLINQVAGTPAQSVDVTSDGGPLTVVVRRIVDTSAPDA
jgi:hypothetical protein